jgi:hypothetical protein
MPRTSLEASFDFKFRVSKPRTSLEARGDLGDQAPGLISSMDTYESMPNSQLQFCIWHAAEAMKKMME